MFDSSLYFSKKKGSLFHCPSIHVKILATALVVSTFTFLIENVPFIPSLKYARMQHQVFVIEVILEASQNLAVSADSWKILLIMRPSDRVI